MRFQLLGGVSVRSDRGLVPLTSARQRAVLAALLVEPGQPVSLDQLAERVWGATPPRSAHSTVHSLLSRLRSALDEAGGPVPVRRPGGYVLEVDQSAIDLHQFRALVARARQANDDRADALWRDAMALWQGQPFAGLDGAWLQAVAATLEAEHQAAVLDHNDLLLRSGEHGRLLPEVTAAAGKHPFDERRAGQLMLALYRSGRQTDALERYRKLQERLADELGSDPGPELRELYQRILCHDQVLAAPTTMSSAVVTGEDKDDGLVAGQPHRPAQLPIDVDGFTGRADALQRLNALLSVASADQAQREVVVMMICGTAGVGKTALAVHWAHQVADEFPDGQLYVNLRGYDPDQPMRPADALARFLAALGVPEREIPMDIDERAARYRSELAGRHMLIVLDNAGSAAQVRPLLPGGGSSLVVVTSRDSLAGLVAVHGAQQVGLELLSANKAVDLLHRLIGDRVAAEPAAAAELAEQCARLPLALRVAAVLAVSRPGSSLAEVVAELADRQERLELLDAGGDPYAAVHAVLSWSVQHLPRQVARVFRRLGLHPGPDLDVYVTAALTGLEPNASRRVLETLVSAHLLHRTGPGRYGMHDLLRAYAAQLTAVEDTEQERDASKDRLFDYYQAAALSAMDAHYPAEVLHRPDAVTSGVPIPDLTRPDAARSWLEAERYCVIAIAEHSAEHQRADYVVGLARILHRYLGDSHLADLVIINGHALRAAERAGDHTGQAYALRQLSVGYMRMSQYETATGHLQRALALFHQVGDVAEQAFTLSAWGMLNGRLGNFQDALDNHREAIVLFRRVGERLGEAFTLTNLGIVEERLGNYIRAAELQRQALVIVRELGARNCEALTLNNLANAELELKREPLAMEHVHQSLAIIEELGSPMVKAHTLDTLGTLYLRQGEPGPAGECFQQAIDYFRQTGERSALACSVNGLGEVARVTGDPAAALSFHTAGLDIATRSGYRHQQARAHAGIGDVHRVTGDVARARTSFEHAYAIYTELGMPDAEDVRARMEEASPSVSGSLDEG